MPTPSDLAAGDASSVAGSNSTRPSQEFAYRGEPLDLFVLLLKNMLLTVLSLGVFLPWAKTERRKYIWQHIEVAGHRLRYHGTGKELFFGYLKVVAAYLVVFVLPLIITRIAGKTTGLVVQVGLVLAVLPLIPFAIWGSRRYLLSRTSWRGIHFRLEGSASAFAKTFFGGYLLTLVTLGIYGPVWTNRMHRMLTESAALGTRFFSYRGSDGAAFKLTVKGVLLSIVTLGVYLFWYQASISRFRMEHTWFDGAHGELDATGLDFLKLTLLQIFGLTLSLGLAFPWIATYTLRFLLARTRFVGPIDFAHIYQAASTGSAAADGLADALDVGLAI